MDDADYYAQREQAELALAQAANDPAVCDIHLTLAAKYAELAKRKQPLEPFKDVRALSGLSAWGRLRS